MTQFESIFKATQISSKVEILKEEVQYYWGRLQDYLFYLPWYWFRTRFLPKHRYHILNLRKSSKNYPYGWQDTDTRMLHACFLLLMEYVEGEQPFAIVDWEDNATHSEVAKEIRDLYDWWKVRRPAAHAAIAAEWVNNGERTKFVKLDGGGFTIHSPDSHKGLIRREQELDEDDNRNLERLIKIRVFLWT